MIWSRSDLRTTLASARTACAMNGATVERVAMDLLRGASGRIERSPGLANARPADRIVSPNIDDVLPGLVSRDELCWLAPNLVLEGYRRLVQERDYEAGPAMPARLDRLVAIEEERTTLQGRHAELVDEAEAAGVKLTHLPEEVAARLNKQRRRAAWEADVRMNSDYYSRVPSARPPEPER